MISKREANLLRSVTETSSLFYLWIGSLSCIILWALYAYIYQLRRGLIVTGMRDQYSWGMYITNFVFFIGISHAGTLISAVLRVTDAGWRRPITRLAEGITVFALMIGGPMVIVDMGRPDRMFNLFTHGRIQSPIFWDVLGVSTYLTGCIIYLYIPMIPDLAFLAQQQEFTQWRRKLYRKLSLGWTGSEKEQHLLEKCISILAIFIIPLAISVHTVVSWIFAMTLRPGWNSSIYGPYFVIGAIYSGGAAVILSMYVLRRVFHLEEYLKLVHFRNLGLLLLTFCLVYIYFNINEYFTTAYKIEGSEKTLVQGLFSGDYSALFWVVQTLLIVVPATSMIIVLAAKGLRRFTPPVLAMASFGVVLGFWLERYLIITPTLASPYLPSPNLPYNWLHYHPTWVEWSITAGAASLLLLIYSLFAKLFPMVSIWETRIDDAGERALIEHRRKEDLEPAGTLASQRLGPLGTTSIILIAFLLFGATYARAAQSREAKEPQNSTLLLEWRQVAATPMNAGAAQAEPGSQDTSAVDRFFGHFFGWLPSSKSKVEAPDPPTIVLTATLTDAKGQPVAYQPIDFTLKTSFGILDYGSRATNPDGKATMQVRDRRYGQYSVEGIYKGSTELAAASTTASVDFGPRPAPSLPSEGVLITPYPTAAIALPFIAFYGTMWVVFFYVGYLIVWRLRQARKDLPNPLA